MNQIRIDQLPEKGYVIFQSRSTLLFEPYTVENGRLLFKGCECLEKEPLTVCHFFNRDREVRLVARESRGDIIERVLTAEEETDMEPDLLYEQVMLVKKEYASRNDLPDRLLVMNRYAFTENDTLALQDYRISCP